MELTINGAPIAIGHDPDWKKITTVDVAQFLHAGSNQIEARVFDDRAPPALWLTLWADQVHLRTDRDWEVELAGSDWRHAVLESDTRFPGPGNPVAGGESTLRSLAIAWPTWLVLGAIALVGLAAGSFLFRSLRLHGAEFSALQIVALVGGAGLLWVILFWHNAGAMPFQEGFDSSDHFRFIKYIQDRWSLPLPTEGFEMFQPPLYYFASAVTLSGCHLLGLDRSPILVLRALTMLFGIANFTFVFLTLRLLCPGKIGEQLVGLLLAAFLPMQLYMSQFVTNETLAAMLVSATIYLAVRAFEKESLSPLQLIIIGAVLGAAVLAKATSFVLIPALLFGIAVKLFRQKVSVSHWLLKMGIPLVVCFALAGWHYLRIWYRMGTPLLGNWDTASGFAWWQDPGFRTTLDYLRFGRSLIYPLFSGFAGFWDGIYSTLWGDALYAGTDGGFPPPWNYPLMIAGYLLAVIPTFMILVGAIVVIHRSLKRPSPAAVMLLSFSTLMILAVAFMTVRVASYAQAKAVYGLSILIPICFFGAIGWSALTSGRRLLRLALGTMLLVFATNAFLSFWIPTSASQHIYTGSRFLIQYQTEAAAAQLKTALQLEPSSATAWRFQSMISNEMKRPDEALGAIERAVQLDPSDSQTRVQLAFLLRGENQMKRASEEARRAVELGPENPFAYHVLTNCLLGANRTDEAFAVAREGLAVLPFHDELHYQFGLVAAQKGDFVTATNQFSYAFLIQGQSNGAALETVKSAILSLLESPDRGKNLHEAVASVPDYPEALSELGWLRATLPEDSLRNGREAVRLTERACILTNNKNQQMLAALAASYAEAGRFEDAIVAAEKAASLAQLQNDAATLNLTQKLLGGFRENHAFRENPTHL